MKNKFIRNAFLFSALIFSLTFFFSCNNMANINGGSISLTLPGATSREGEGSVEYIFNVSLEGETSQSKTGISGQTVVFEDLDVGDYEVKVEAFEKATGYVYAQGSEKTTILAGQISYVTVYLQKVWLEPTITKQPEDKTVNLIKTDATSGAAQGSVTLSIEAEVNQGGDLSYLWQKLEGGEWEIVERNSADYTLNFTTENANQTYQYRCRVFHNEGASGALNEEEGTGRTCFVDSRIVTVTVGGVKTLTGISARFKDGANEYYTIGGTGEAFSRFYNDLILTETYSDGTSLEITPDMNLYPANPVDTSCQIGDLTIKLFPTVKPEISCTISSKWKYESVLPTLSVTEPSSLGEITLGGSEASSFNLTYNVGVTTPSSYKCTDGKSYSDTLSYQWYYWKVTEDTPTGEERVVTPIGIQSEAPTATFTPTEAGEYEFYLQLILSCSAYSTTPGETKKSTPVIIYTGTVSTPSTEPTDSITSWSDLSAAVSDASAGATLKVSGNMTADYTIEISKELTIVAAGSGCTITRGDGFYTTSGDPNNFFKVVEGGNLTLGGESSGTLALDGGYKADDESTIASGAIVQVYQTSSSSTKVCKL